MMNKIKIPLHSWDFFVEIYDINVPENDSVVSFELDYEQEDLDRNNITIEDVEKEVGEWIIAALEDMIKRRNNE